ncbi:hypothetical protein LPJ75_002329 [Coemansia sp. RSA 2598]|nr:hypothetical protein LPJ75_002329 [Coemansia sp. RSA 2598]
MTTQKRRLLRHPKQWGLSEKHTFASGKGVVDRIKATAQSLLEAFLPTDYKTSVTPEYMGYAKWQFVHNTLGAASGVLATQAMLYAMGLGAGALPLSAAINWVIKDGFGQLGGVAYATMVGQKFDSDSKHLRFWSAVWLQCATWLEMLTPLVPHLFLPIGCVANIGKNISWLAMSATKASINKSFCRQENLGDLTAKHGSQATAAGLLGTAMGILVGATMDISFHTLVVGFVPLSLVSLWGNYKSILYTATPTLNLERTRHMLADAVALDANGQLAFNPYLLKTPRQVSPVERFMREIKCIEPEHVLPGIVVSANINRVYRDLTLGLTTEAAKAEAAQMAEAAFNPPVVLGNSDMEWCERYYIGYLARSSAKGSCNGNIYLWFDTRATSEDVLLGLYHSMALRLLLAESTNNATLDIASVIDGAYQFARHTFGDLGKAVAMNGWDITNVYFGKKSKSVQIEPVPMQAKQ